MACNAEISTSTISHHKHRNRNRPTAHSIPNPKPRTRSGSGHVTQDPNKRNSSALMGRKEDGGKSKFIGLGCVSSTPVSAPEVIRTAADWEERGKKGRGRSKASKKVVAARVGISADVCCGPGIGFAADAALVDCVDSRRPVGPRTSHRQHIAATRLPMPFEDVPILDFEAASNSVLVHPLRRRADCGLPEIRMLDSGTYPGRSFSVHDRFGGWRLDVDSMSYEELLALGDRIGYVGTGLKEEEIHRFIRKIKQSMMLESLPLLASDSREWSCRICQDGFEGEDEIGKLECNHLYHMHCIKQWLLQKNACPVCKAAAATKP